MSFNFILSDHCDYDFEEDSDQERGISSSEDEVDIILHGTPKQKRKLRRLSIGHASSSSEDDFEKQMELEISEHVADLENQRKGLNEETDNVEASPSGTKKAKLQEPAPSNDDLLYDPNMDDEDAIWVASQRKTYQVKDSGTSKAKKLPQSDAVLNCPACMTTLCLDCQRHSMYKTQYRAMFVMNCQVDKAEVLRFPKKEKKNFKQAKKNLKRKARLAKNNLENNDVSADKKVSDDTIMKTSNNQDKQKTDSNSLNVNDDLTDINMADLEKVTPEGASSSDAPAADNIIPVDGSHSNSASSMVQEDMYHPVKCTECNTEVAVIDKEEIYHFFNVLSSYT